MKELLEVEDNKKVAEVSLYVAKPHIFSLSWRDLWMREDFWLGDGADEAE